jgi:tetratricopeptide (TPR) repeat protein
MSPAPISLLPSPSLPLPLETLSCIARSVSFPFPHLRFGFLPKHWCPFFSTYHSYGNFKCHYDAINAYREALRIDPEYRNAWNGLGYTYLKLKRYLEAIDAFREALRIDPGYGPASTGLGIAYFRAGKRSNAMKVVRELRCLDPERAETLFNLVKPENKMTDNLDEENHDKTEWGECIGDLSNQPPLKSIQEETHSSILKAYENYQVPKPPSKQKGLTPEQSNRIASYLLKRLLLKRRNKGKSSPSKTPSPK